MMAGRASRAAGLLGLLVLSGAGPAHAQTTDRVQLQLKWLVQAQFAGYVAAEARGFYAAERLEVRMQPGGPDIVPEQVVADGGATAGRNSASAGCQASWRPGTAAPRSSTSPRSSPRVACA
jgi:NitT/TauT family transport system substrate-binding protein